MRRQSDNWVNATHILKAAGFDKPARTRILERDVQKGNHEKVQGGYGKFQGTKEPPHSFECCPAPFFLGDSLSLEFHRFRNISTPRRRARTGPTT